MAAGTVFTCEAHVALLEGIMSMIRFPHPVAFWAGIVAVSAGVTLHLPMFLTTRDSGHGQETRRRRLEDITRAELRTANAAA
jgi:hypothetical protein